MKAAGSPLKTFLLTTNKAIRADLYTITLNGGAVQRYSSFDAPITMGGQIFGLGPVVSDGGVQSQRARPAGGQSSGISRTSL